MIPHLVELSYTVLPIKRKPYWTVWWFSLGRHSCRNWIVGPVSTRKRSCKKFLIIIYWLAVNMNWSTSAISWRGYAIDSRNTTPTQIGQERGSVCYVRERLQEEQTPRSLWAYETTSTSNNFKEDMCSLNILQCYDYFSCKIFCDVVCHCLDLVFKKWLRLAQLVVSWYSIFEK